MSVSHLFYSNKFGIYTGECYHDGGVSILATTQSTSSITGSLIVNGGVGVKSDLHVGGYVNNVYGSLNTIGMFNFMETSTIADDPVNPNPEISFIDDHIYGSKIILANTIHTGQLFNIRAMGLISSVSGKVVTLKIYVGPQAYTAAFSYTNSTTNVLFDIDIYISIRSVIGNTATISISGRTFSGIGILTVSRVFAGSITCDTTLNNNIDVTYQYSDINKNAINTLSLINGTMTCYN